MVDTIIAPESVASEEVLSPTQIDAEQSPQQPLPEPTENIPLVPEEQVIPQEEVQPEEVLDTAQEEQPKVEPTEAEIANAEYDVQQAEKIAKQTPHVFTKSDVLEKYTAPNLPKNTLLDMLDSDPVSGFALISSGALKLQDIHAHRISKMGHEAEQNYQALENAWIKNPDGVFSVTINAVLNILTSGISAGLSIPEAALTHYNVATQEAVTETDNAYKTYLLGSEQLRLASRTKDDASMPLNEREEAQATYELLKPELDKLYSELVEQDDFHRTREKYLTGYYNDAASNFISKARASIDGIVNKSAINDLAAYLGDAVDNDLDTLYQAKEQLDNGNLLAATANLVSGLVGITADTVDALITNPAGFLDVTAQSIGYMGAGGLVGAGLRTGLKVGTARGAAIANTAGAAGMYQSMYSVEAYQTFEREYSHLPDAQQAILLNGVTALAALLSVGGDSYMLNGLKQVVARPKQASTLAIAEAMSAPVDTTTRGGMLRRLKDSAIGAATSRTIKGGLAETVQEFTENLAVQYAGKQDLSKIDIKDATVEALMASVSGAGFGVVGDFGKSVRSIGKGKLRARFNKAKATSSVTRTDMSDVNTIGQTISDSVTALNEVDSNLIRDAKGKVESTQSNVVAISDMYDRVLSDIAGLDILFAGFPTQSPTTLKQDIDTALANGTPINTVINDAVKKMTTEYSAPKLQAAIQSSPELMNQLMSRMATATPEQRVGLQQNLTDTVNLVSRVASNIGATATSLTKKYDLEAMVNAVDKQTSQQRRDSVFKRKQAKEQTKVSKAKEEATKDIKGRSSLSPEQLLKEFDEALIQEEPSDIKYDSEVPAPTGIDIKAANSYVSEASPEVETPLNSPTVAKTPYQQVYAANSDNVTKTDIVVPELGTLAEADTRIHQLYSELRNNVTPENTNAYLATVLNVAKALESLTTKATLSDIEKRQAAYLANGVAAFVQSYAALDGTNNKALATLKGKGAPNYTKIAKALAKAKVSNIPNLFTVISKSAETKVTEPTTTQANEPSTGSITRPAAGVYDTTILGSHTTEDLIKFKVPEAFSMLNRMVTAILSDTVTNIPKEFTEDVLEVLTSDSVAFDKIYTALTSTDSKYKQEAEAAFTDFGKKAAAEKESATAYIALADYFKTIDPNDRDLTTLLSKYIPAVKQALDAQYAKITIPSEFTSKVKPMAAELVHEPLLVNPDEITKDTTERYAMVIDGLDAIRLAGTDTVNAFIDSLVNEEGLDPNGNTVLAITDYLTNPDATDIAVAYVNATMISRINTLINTQQLPNTSKATETKTTWNTNNYNGVAEAFNRLKLGSTAFNNFNVQALREGGMYQVMNIFSVLQDPEHENYSTVISSFTPEELTALETILPYIQDMRNVYGHIYSANPALTNYTQNNVSMDLFETMLIEGSSAKANNYMHPNLSAIIAQTALEYVTSDGVMQLGFNDEESLKSLTSDYYQVPQVASALSTGSSIKQIAPRLGATIRKRLGISADTNKATSAELGQLENSLGHLALLGLVNTGLISFNTVAIHTKENDIAVTTQADFNKVNPIHGYTLDAGNIFHMVSFNEQKVAELDKQHGKAFVALSLPKALTQKLYGKEQKADITFTPDDVVVLGGNKELNVLAKEVAKKNPQYLHEGKFTVFDNLSTAAQEELFGGNLDASIVHIDKVKPIEAKNRKAKTDVARVYNHIAEMKAQNSNAFYLHQIVGANTRFTGTNPKGIDPIGMSAARYLVNVEPKTTITIGSDSPVENMFYKIIVQALDLSKAEEISNAEAKALFSTLENNLAFIEAMDIVNQSKERKLTEEESAELISVLKAIKGESLAHTLDAVWTYSNYHKAKTDGVFSFDGTIFGEIDGKNNGSAWAIEQNAPIADIDDMTRMAASVGLNYTVDATQAYAEIKSSTPDFLDAYQHLTKASGEVAIGLIEGSISDDEITLLLGNATLEIDDRVSLFNAIMPLLAGTLGTDRAASFLHEGKVTSEGRNLFKQVLMTVLYGASVGTQDRYFTGVIISKYLDKLGEFSTQEDTPELRANVQEYIATLNSLLTVQKIPMPNFKINNWQEQLRTEKYSISYKAQQELLGLVTNTIGITYRKALKTTTYNTIITQANSLVESSNVMHLRTHFAVKTLLAKFKASEGIPDKQELTIAQEEKFYSEVRSRLTTGLSYPLGSVDEDVKGTNGVRFTKRTKARQTIPQSAYDSADAAYTKALQEDPNFKGSRDQFLPEQYAQQIVVDFAAQGITGNLSSQILSNILESPDQSAAPSGVHSLDSSTQAYVAKFFNAPMLNIFDAIGGTPETLVYLANAGNTAFNAINANYNLYSDAAASYAELDTAMGEVLSKEELEVIDDELANALGQPNFKYSDYSKEIQSTYTTIGNRAVALRKSLVSLDQYPMTQASPVTVNGDERSPIEDTRNDFSDSLDMDSFVNITELGSVETGRNAAINAVKLVKGETEVLREILAQDTQLYSTKGTEVGKYVSDTIKTFADSLTLLGSYVGDSVRIEAAKEISSMLKGLRYNSLLRLPNLEADSLFDGVNTLLMTSNISGRTKQLIARDSTQLLLRGSEPSDVDTSEITSDVYTNMWLSIGDNIKWANAPLSKLLSAEFAKAVLATELAGVTLSPNMVVMNILTSPNTKAYIGGTAANTPSQLIANSALATLNSLPAKEATDLLFRARQLAKSSAKNKIVPALASLFLIREDVPTASSWFIPGKNKLVQDEPAKARAYYKQLSSNILKMYENNGYFSSGTLTPEIVSNQLKHALFTNEQLTTLGMQDVVPQPEPQSDLVLDYDTEKLLNIEYMGFNFPISTNAIVQEINGGLRISWRDKEVDTSHIYEATGGQLTPVPESSISVVVKPMLGTPTFDNTTSDTTASEISLDSLSATFDEVIASSMVQDSASHTSHLRSLVATMSQGLDKVKLRIEHVTNKVTSGYFLDNTVTVSINQLLPRSVTNFMSAGEVMAHELTHAITANIDDISPTLSARTKELYTLAKRNLTVDMLIDPNIHPDDAREVAQKLYDYMFVENVVSKEYKSSVTNVPIKRFEGTRLAEFMVLATTNETVMAALDNINAGKKQYSGITAKLIQILNALLGLFFRKIDNRLSDASITKEMVDIVYKVSKLQNQHKSVLSRTVLTLSDIVDKGFTKLDTNIKEMANVVGMWALAQPSIATKAGFYNPKSYLAAIATPVVILSNAENLREKAHAMFRQHSLMKHRFMQDLFNELTTGDPAISRIKDFISRRVQTIDMVRNSIEASIINTITRNLFKTPMSDKVARALTRTILETDFVKLVEVFGTDRALDILHTDNKRLHSLRKQYQNKLKQYEHAIYYINHAKALGEMMAQGNTKYYGVHSNAHSIANLAGDTSFGSVETEYVTEITELVDVLASIYAVMNVEPSIRMAARNFLLAEKNSTEVKHSGLTAILNMHKEAQDKALVNNFYGNPQLMRKGYIKETYNPHKELVIVNPDDIVEYEQQGFVIVGNVPKGLMKVTPDGVIMVNNYSNKFTYDQGAFSHTGFAARGSKISFSEYDADGLNVLSDQGSVSMDKARKSMFTNTPIIISNDVPVAIAPTRDESGAIKGYRYLMRTSTKEEVLERATDVGTVLAKTVSSVEDKVNSQLHNNLVVDEIFSIYDKDYKKNPDSFVFISPSSDNKSHVEMWAMLPAYTRAIIDSKKQGRYEQTGIYVPNHLLTLLFGSTPMSLAKFDDTSNVVVKYGVNVLNKILTNKWGRIGGKGYLEALGSAKDSLVIKSITTTLFNMVSNVYALSITGIPMSYVAKKSIQGYKEILRYQQLMSKITNINTQLMHVPMGSSKADTLRRELQELEADVSSLSVTKLVDEGLYQTIVEDVDTQIGKQQYQTEFGKVGDRLLGMTGKAETALREGVFITQDSIAYRHLRDAAQISDFVSRYVMFSHMLENGSSVEEAVHKSRDTFILYDAPLNPVLKGMNDIGFMNFTKFLFRTQGVLRNAISESPTRALLYSVVWMNLFGLAATMEVLATPFNFGELLMRRVQLNPLDFVSNSVTQLPLVNLLVD